MNRFARSAAVIGGSLVAASQAAHAALPANVTTAVGDYQTDATTAIGLIMAAGVVIWGLNKLAVKLGWK